MSKNYHGNSASTSNRPTKGSQQDRLLKLLEQAHSCRHPLTCPSTKCGRVPLPRILALYISQYGARLYDLRHRWGFIIESGDNGDPSRTWFRLKGRASAVIDKELADAIDRDDLLESRRALRESPPQSSLFDISVPEPTKDRSYLE
jgi:hypothetical protein